MALAEILAFWCGGDTEQMGRLFRQSGLMRDKLNRAQSGSNYGILTPTKAVKKCIVFYSPMMATADEEFIDKSKEQTLNVDSFLKLVRKYTYIKELTAEIIRSFVEKIDVYKPEKMPEIRTKKQTICIHWIFIGAVDIPIKHKKNSIADFCDYADIFS